MSVDNTMDVDAKQVLVRPRCGLHDRDLELIGSRPVLYKEADFEEPGNQWWVDLSEFACPSLSEDLRRHEMVTVSLGSIRIHARQVDDLIIKDNESWYMAVQLEVRTLNG